MLTHIQTARSQELPAQSCIYLGRGLTEHAVHRVTQLQKRRLQTAPAPVPAQIHTLADQSLVDYVLAAAAAAAGPAQASWPQMAGEMILWMS